MAAYATVADYEAKYGTLSGPSEEGRVSVMLEDTSLFVDALVERKGIDRVERADGLKALCRDFTHRVYENEKSGNVTALTHQAGSFIEMQKFKRLKDDFDAFARDYYSILGVPNAGVCFAWPGAES